jgi:hypothetical protein
MNLETHRILMLKTRKHTIWLCYAKAKPSISLDYRRQEFLFLSIGTKIDQRGTSDGIPTSQCPNDSEITASSNLVDANKIVKTIPFRRFDSSRQFHISHISGNCVWIDCHSSVAPPRVFLDDLNILAFGKDAAI